MVVTLLSASLAGVDAVPVAVEVDVASGHLPGYHVVGLSPRSVREGTIRIRAALEHVGRSLPRKRVTVNLAPADLAKDGASFDLPIAVGICVAQGLIPPESVQGLLFLGELGLDGGLRPVRGALAAAMLAKETGCRGLVMPAESAPEARAALGAPVLGADGLREVIEGLCGEGPFVSAESDEFRDSEPGYVVDMKDVRGQKTARFALEVAVSGGHHILMAGPPGIGKTMLAKRVPTILPPMSREESLGTTRVFSSLGLCRSLVRTRPFRGPHHTISTAALVGGGRPVRPGELSLAHNGVLFLDELPEFRREALESLRQPLEERSIWVTRVHERVRFPADFLLVASANLCPCGYLGTPTRSCTCSYAAIQRYRTRLSGPILDRIDIQVHVAATPWSSLRGVESAETSRDVRQRVLAARGRQQARAVLVGCSTNAALSGAGLHQACQLDSKGERLLERIHQKHRLSGRGLHRLLRVARTVADLSNKDNVDCDALHEASLFRALSEVYDDEIGA